MFPRFQAQAAAMLLATGLSTNPTQIQAQEWPAKWSVALLGFKECYSYCSEDEKATTQTAKEQGEALRAWALEELPSIETFFRQHGIDAIKLPRRDAPVSIVDLTDYQKREANRQDASGQYSEDVGVWLFFRAMLKEGAVPPRPAQKPQTYEDQLAASSYVENSSTLAHELYHGVQAGLGLFDKSDWILEGEAAAADYIWAKSQWGFGISPWQDLYSEPLHQPADPYSRGRFFRILAYDHGSGRPLDWLYRLTKFRETSDGHDLTWLDEFLKRPESNTSGKGLADIFPEYISRAAAEPEYYKTTIDPAPVIANARPGAEEVSPSVSRPINAAAADRSEASLTFAGGWTAADPWDTLALIRLDIPLAAAPDDLRLIVDKQIFDVSKSYQVVAAGQDGMQWSTPFHVTNMAAKPSLSREQTYQPRLRVSPLRLFLPQCAVIGQPTRISLSDMGASFDPAEVAPLVAPYLKAASGMIGPDLTYTATKAGEDEITLTTFAPDGSTRTATRTIHVNTSGCMERMVFDGGIATYNPVGDYTEFLDTRSGSALYFGQDRLAAWEGGWMDIPPEARNMLLAGIKGAYDPMIEATGGQGVGPEGQETITRFPRTMRQTFGNAWVQNALSETKPTAEPCPPGWGGGCTRLKGAVENETGVNIDILYDGTGLPITVTMNGATLSFEVGDFPIRRPPGW